MENKNLKITHAYHFLSEAIIIYLLILPIMYHYYLQVPYWAYIAIIIVLSILYTIYAKFTHGHLFYILSAPFVIAVFWMVGYPIGLSVTFAGLLTWRYIAIRSELYLKREQTYIIATLILTILGILYIRDLTLIIFFLLQIIIVFGGNILSHIAVTSKQEQKLLNRVIWLNSIGYVVLVVGFILVTSDLLRYASLKIYEFIRMIAMFLASLFVRLIPNLDYENLIDWEKFRLEEIPFEDEEELGSSILGLVMSSSVTYLIISLLIVIAGILLIIRQLRSRVKFREEEDYSVTDDNLQVKKEKIFTRLNRIRKWRFLKPSHPARKLVFNFERMATKYKRGREKFETIEDWLQRIGLTSNLDTYQKVRYGNEDVSEQEIRQLEMELKEIMNFLQNSETNYG